MFNTFLYTPLLQTLVFLYHLLGDSFGLALIALTVGLRAVMVPFTIPSIKSQKKLLDLQPEIQALKKQHKDNKMEFQKAQLALYKSHGVNPGAGCLPQIIQIVILIALYRVFLNFLNGGDIDGKTVNMNFLWLNLGKPDPYFTLPLLAGLSQLVYSLMLRPGTEHPHPKEALVAKKEQKEEKDEMAMAQEIQNQMLFMMPIMTTVISLRFPSGLALYWVISTVFSLVQQWVLTGPGGLRYYWSLAQEKVLRRTSS